MDLAEYIRQKKPQDIFKEAASKEYHRTSVKDRLEQIQNDRRQTRDTLLNSKRNITNLSPITPTPTTSREQTKVSKKVNNMREKLAKWRAEKQKRKLEEKKKIRPVFKVSHVPDKIELPPPPPHIKSKFAPLDHVFAPPKNIKPIAISMPPSSLNNPIERKLPGRDEKIDNKRKMPKTSTMLSKVTERKLPYKDTKSDIKKKVLQMNTNCLTEKIAPLGVQRNNQKAKIIKSVDGKENSAKLVPSKNLQTTYQKKNTFIPKCMVATTAVSSNSINNKNKFISNLKELKGAPSTSKAASRRDTTNKQLKHSMNQIVICESTTDEDKKNIAIPKHKKRSKTEENNEQKVNMEEVSKRHQSSRVSGSDMEIDLISSHPHEATVANVQCCMSGTDVKKNSTEEPVKDESIKIYGDIDLSLTTFFPPNLSNTDDNLAMTLGQKPKSVENVEQHEKQQMEIKGKIVRFDSTYGICSDDVFKTPIKISNRTGILSIESEVNSTPSKPASMKKYKRTPYKSSRESETFYSDDEICLKSPAVKKSRSSFKELDIHATPELSEFLGSTSDSGGSFQYITVRRNHKSRTPVSPQGSPKNVIDTMPNQERMEVPDTRGRSSTDPCDVEVIVDLKASKPNESVGTRKSLKTDSKTCRRSLSETSNSSQISNKRSSLTKNKTSHLDTSNPKANEVFDSSFTGNSVKTPIKKRGASSVKIVPSSDLDVLDHGTPKSSEISEILDSPSIKMSLRTRLRKRGNSSAKNESTYSKNSEWDEKLGTRKSLRTSIKNRRSSSITGIDKSPANRKSHIKLLQKYEESSPSAEMKVSNPNECDTKVESVTTPEARNRRVSFSNIETPEQTTSGQSSVYVSPFVTISRGKNSARKEYHVRNSTGGTLPGAEAATSPKAGAQYFYGLLNHEIERIEEQCQTGSEERTVTCQDLHGFWDMVFLQVEDVDKRFNYLNKLKENNWREIIPEKKVVRSKSQRKTKTKAASKIKEMIDAARKKKGQEQQATSINDLPVILTEGAKVGNSQPIPPSPRPSPGSSITKPASSVKRSLRASLLTNQLQQKRRQSSPGLVMMNVSQMIKLNDGLTPCKSILKNTQQSKSEKRITKTVLFKEELEEERRFGID
nr:unnamed protein product [Callosobruchus analis]